MSLELRNKLLTIASGGLMIAGVIFIILSIFSDFKNNNCLFATLFSIVLLIYFISLKI